MLKKRSYCSCPLPDILQKILQRFALQACQQSGKVGKRQNEKALEHFRFHFLCHAERSEAEWLFSEAVKVHLLPVPQYASGLLSPCWSIGKPSVFRASEWQGLAVLRASSFPAKREKSKKTKRKYSKIHVTGDTNQGKIHLRWTFAVTCYDSLGSCGRWTTWRRFRFDFLWNLAKFV